MKLQIDIPHRYACMRAHTATHLLHAELGKIFPQTKQAGSYVGPDELRFDFFAERSLTAEEIKNITNSINMIIAENQIVTVQEMSYEQAIQTGAKAFFEDTYPEVVRVVSMQTTSSKQQATSNGELQLEAGSQNIGSLLSIELCGGTHVSETSQIGSFFITEQTAVAAGVKRIVALTGPKVAVHTQAVQDTLNEIVKKLEVSEKQVLVKIDKNKAELKNAINGLRVRAKLIIEKTEPKERRIGEYNIDTIRSLEDDLSDVIEFLPEAAEILKSMSQFKSWFLYTKDGQYAFFHPQAKQIAQELGLKGGGSDTFVQGRDEKIVGLMF